MIKTLVRISGNQIFFWSPRLIVFFCFLALAAALPAGWSLAHVSADNMPDSVAETEYLIYLEFRPNDLTIRNKLGMVFYRLGKLDLAAGEFSTILRKEPDNYDALDGMGLVQAARQQYDEAVEYHQRAIALKGDDMMTHYHLGQALEKKGRLPEAAAAYQSALDLYGKQYPDGTGEKQAAEFLEAVRSAMSNMQNNH